MSDGGTLTEPARRAEPDAALIRRSWREPERFADVFDRHYDGIHAFATRRLGASLADDVASETFLIAFDRRRRYDVAQPSARPWLLRPCSGDRPATGPRIRGRRRTLNRTMIPGGSTSRCCIALEGYRQQAALPTDPQALLDWAYSQTDLIAGAGTTDDAEVYAIFRGLLGAGVLPPGLAAGVYRAIKEIPGVTVSREGALLAVTLTDGGLRQSLLLDADTYTYAGARSVVVGKTSKPGDGGTSIRLKTGIVDYPE